MATLEKQFADAQADVKQLSEIPDNETLLELYSYFKQATEGDVKRDKPSAFDFKERAKYDAWQARQGMSSDVAMKGYVKVVNHLKSR